ncbi:MAG: endonuclease [Succinivibrionaceae bacterium]
MIPMKFNKNFTIAINKKNNFHALSFIFLIIILLFLFTDFFLINTTHAQTFSESKKQLTSLYRHTQNPKTFYCNCPIKIVNKKLIPDLEACNYQPQKIEARAKRIEWEHIMPASWLGNQLQCWKNGGRKNCSKNKLFVEREGDMHNLVPAIGEINAVRSNYRYAMLDKSLPKFNSCDFVVSNKSPKAVMPAPYTRGFIARTFLYMSEKYNIKLSKNDKNLMDLWNSKYPVNVWECRRNNAIEEMQGNDNPYITEQCKKLNIK